MKRRTNIPRWPRSIAAALAYILVMGATAQDYKIYDLGMLSDPEIGGDNYGSGALAISDLGEVVGWVTYETELIDAPRRALIWLPQPNAAYSSWARGAWTATRSWTAIARIRTATVRSR